MPAKIERFNGPDHSILTTWDCEKEGSFTLGEKGAVSEQGGMLSVKGVDR